MADTGTEKLLINLFCYNLTINTGVDTRVVTATRYVHYTIYIFGNTAINTQSSEKAL